MEKGVLAAVLSVQKILLCKRLASRPNFQQKNKRFLR